MEIYKVDFFLRDSDYFTEQHAEEHEEDEHHDEDDDHDEHGHAVKGPTTFTNDSS